MSKEPEKNNEELERSKAQAEEYLNNWKRERADFINYKKDESKRVEEFLRFANEALVLEIVDILDNLYLGLKHDPNEIMKKLSKDFEELLRKYGVERVEVEGKGFDPVLHEAVEALEGNNLKELRPGYTMHGKVIRPARVQLVK